MKIQLSIFFVILIYTGTSQASGGGGGGSSPYITLDPPFVVNIQDGEESRFLQITSELRLTNPDKASVVQHHMPMIRHYLVMLFSEQTADSVASLEGKERLREETLEVLQAKLEEETGDALVENIYFTGFIIQ
jgi:flagellar FliL protein